MKYKLGKLPPSPPTTGPLKMGAMLEAAKIQLPQFPKVFGHIKNSIQWQMLGNDQNSDCVFAGYAHEAMIYALSARRAMPRFTTESVLADYARQTGFDPAKPDTDQGADMQEAAEWRRTVGITDADGKVHKILAHAPLRKNWNDMLTAIWLFGAVGVGFRLPDNADKLFDAQKPWVPVKGTQIEGGHYTSGCGLNSKGQLVVSTWGRLQGVTREFWEEYCDEMRVYLTDENLQNNLSPENYDLPALQAYFHALPKH